MEQRGIPAAAVMTDRFTETAQLMAAVYGVPDYRFAIVAHPISSDGEPALRAKAADAVRQCIAVLLRR